MCKQHHRNALNPFLNGLKNGLKNANCKQCLKLYLHLAFFGLLLSALLLVFLTSCVSISISSCRIFLTGSTTVRKKPCVNAPYNKKFTSKGILGVLNTRLFWVFHKLAKLKILALLPTLYSYLQFKSLFESFDVSKSRFTWVYIYIYKFYWLSWFFKAKLKWSSVGILA